MDSSLRLFFPTSIFFHTSFINLSTLPNLFIYFIFYLKRNIQVPTFSKHQNNELHFRLSRNTSTNIGLLQSRTPLPRPSLSPFCQPAVGTPSTYPVRQHIDPISKKFNSKGPAHEHALLPPPHHFLAVRTKGGVPPPVGERRYPKSGFLNVHGARAGHQRHRHGFSLPRPHPSPAARLALGLHSLGLFFPGVLLAEEVRTGVLV